MDPFSNPSVDVIKPVVAGRFYPSDPVELARDVRQYLEEADIEPAVKPVLAVLCPHAGYVFSGPVAGYSYRYVQEQHPDTILIVALSHHHALNGGCMFMGNFFETPLGRVAVDRELTEALLEAGMPLFADVDPYLVEHSVEVNLPFVQTVFPNAKVASMLISRADSGLCREIGQRIAATLRNHAEKQVLIVVSSDMSHYPPYDVANRIDKEMLASLETLDPERIESDLDRLGSDPAKNVHCVMCGGAAMLAVVETARELGAHESRILCYRNSGDTSFGESHRVVGYGSFAIYADTAEEIDIDESEFENEIPLDGYDFSDEDKKTLLGIARQSIQAVLHKESYEPLTDNPRLKTRCGVFVTLKNGGHLRGCLGRFDPGDLPLEQLVAVMAAQSATHDIRFKPVALDEIPELDIQISVLTPLERVQDIGDIEIGKHGLQIQGRSGYGAIRSGTLLPQVASEQDWDVESFLNATCVKAGLEAEKWKDPETEIWKYGAIVFGDLDFGFPPYRS